MEGFYNYNKTVKNPDYRIVLSGTVNAKVTGTENALCTVRQNFLNQRVWVDVVMIFL